MTPHKPYKPETSGLSGAPEPPDNTLIANSLNGDHLSLDQLLSRYSDWVYNLCCKMVMNRQDAEDLSQEILIRVITKLSTFRQDSLFSTWLYRIAVNHILNYKKSAAVRRQNSFIQFGKTLDDAPDEELSAGEYYEADKPLLVEETRQTCMSAMLLCLDTRHRLVFILGELFGINDKTGGEAMDISPENFRMMLSRSRKDLYSFMQDKCGLINKDNPCRCAKKTQAFIRAGFVNPSSLQFARGHLYRINEVAGDRQEKLEDLLHHEYRDLYRQHSFLHGPGFVQALRDLLYSDKMDLILHTRRSKPGSDPLP